MKKAFLALALLTAIALSTFLAGCSATTANLSDIKICDKLEGDSCAADNPSLAPDAETFYVTASLNSAPSGTRIDVSWKYLGGELGKAQDIDAVSMVSDENSNVIESSLQRSASAWPRGDYQVTLRINADNVDPVSKQFSVK
ncbi:MAG: hypothetical protein ACYC6Z_08140 [Thermoleophilia bacterium]